jgi:CheY-specific phosphatase CheX
MTKFSTDDLLTPFQEGTEKTLMDLCKTQILSVKVLERGKLPPNVTSVAGLIGITSPTLQGSVSIQFSTKVFLGIINLMLGTNYTELTPDIEDGAAEFTNIIFGYAKNELNKKGMGIQMALPSLLSGKTIHSAGSAGSQSIQTVAYLTDFGAFYQVFNINQKNEDVLPPSTKTEFHKNFGAEVLLEFVKAGRVTMETQFGTLIEIGTPFLKSTSGQFTFEVGSIIGVTDQNFSGFFGMYYEKATFLALINKMLGENYTEVDAEVQDGASEITNVCFGVAKQVLNQKGHAIRMALPSLIRGDQLQSSACGKEKNTITVPIKTEAGKFWIEFGFKETEQ